MRFTTENIYCTKCGLRGYSKCPHCRSIFDSYDMEDVLRYTSQQYLENFVNVRTVLDSKVGEDQKYEVYFETWATDSEQARKQILQRLNQVFSAKPNLEVAACVHEWDFLPGEQSHCGCGHYGAEGATVPADPFAEK